MPHTTSAPTDPLPQEQCAAAYPELLAERLLGGGRLTDHECLELLRTPDDATFRLVAAASRLRRQHFGATVKVNYLVSLRTGLCPEDCTYCSQRLGTGAEILKYTWLKPEEAVAQASHGIAAGARRVCLVASGTGPTDRDVDRVGSIVTRLKSDHPDVEVCACLGLLKEGQAERLGSCGVDAYNHNLNTARSHYPEICSTHGYDDRVETVGRAVDAGLSPCSGLIVGMGESDEQLVEALAALRDLDADSVPVNFLMPFDGTPLEGRWELTPLACLRILAVARMICPDKEIRIAAGREMHLRSLQPLALEVANSLFLGDYLTSEGQGAADDLTMIRDAGFTVIGADGSPASTASPASPAADRSTAPAPRAETARPATSPPPTPSAAPTDSATAPAPAPAATPAIRRRGAGTDVAPNA
ncbi:biotin synthase BioB [Nesterenkonia sp. K-15-9-6]|uniref:biotin synthase BioB n=1 Tax=Nesterenkonia sp. K-15-9-6 TaxID=3093918 RepID=UPI004044264F